MKVTEQQMRKKLLAHITYPYLREEVNVLGSRVDLFASDGKKLVGYEIKSDYDTPKRLHSQMQNYTQVFDEVWLAVGKRNILQAIYEIPENTGILLITNKVSLIRKAEQNQPTNLANMLPKQEVLYLLKQFNEHKGLSRKPKHCLTERLNELAEKNTTILRKIKGEILKKVYPQTV